MYQGLLFVHSWVRWLVLGAMIAMLVYFAVSAYRRKAFSEDDDSLVFAFNQIFLLQVAFGFTLWVSLSPIVHVAFRNPKMILSDVGLTFWAIRHPITMLVSLCVLHAGRMYAKGVRDDRRHVAYAVVFAVTLACICSAIPWPWLAYGRNLFRGF